MEVIREPGLYGTGPLPIHLYSGNPTPWSEGCVFRIVPDNSESWLANVQQGGYGDTFHWIWEEAGKVFLIANGDCYFVDPDHPENWKHIANCVFGCDILFVNQVAVMSTNSSLIGVDLNGQEIWNTTVAIDGLEITKIEDGVVCGIGNDIERWRPFKVRTIDGLLIN